MIMIILIMIIQKKMNDIQINIIDKKSWAATRPTIIIL